MNSFIRGCKILLSLIASIFFVGLLAGAIFYGGIVIAAITTFGAAAFVVMLVAYGIYELLLDRSEE